MTNQNAMQIEDPKVNGVAVGRIMSTIESIEDDVENAKFQFRLNNHWVEGGLNRSRIKEFFAVGREDDTRTEAFVVDADQPYANAGEDSAPNPMEWVLHSLASCLTTTMVYHAAVQGVEIDSVESWLEGDLDVRGILGLSDDVRKAYNKVRVRMQVKSAASVEELKALALYSPVYDLVSKSLPTEFIVEKI